MSFHERKNSEIQKLKYLIVSFSIVLSAVVGLVLPLFLSESSAAAPLENLISTEQTGKENEPDFAYLTLFAFKELNIEIEIGETNILRFLISEKNGIASYDGITARVEIPAGEKECIKVAHEPFSVSAVSAGRNILHLTAKERDGNPITISATFVVKEKAVPANPKPEETKTNTEGTDGNKPDKNDTTKTETAEGTHTVDFDYDPENSILKIYYRINGVLQSDDVFKIVNSIGGSIMGEGIGGGYQFYAQEQWEITVKHIETEKEIIIRFPRIPD